MTDKVKKPFLPVVLPVKNLLKLYFKIRYNLSGDNKILDEIEPPYIVLANHVNNLDPFFVNMFIKQPIQYVTSDAYFRAKYLKFILTDLAGAIAKVKSMSDSQAVKNILRVKQQNGIIGIFPEGRRTWDGDSLNSIYSTAKLVKLLKIPVVFVKIKGAHLARPRWAEKTRKGQIHLNYDLMLNGDEIKNMSVDEIHNVIESNLKYSEYDYQRKVMNKYKTSNRAEHLELMLFMCPHCKKIETMVSNKHKFYCTECGYSVHYTETGFFEAINNKLYFDNPADWNKWQKEELYKLLKDSKQTGKNVFEDNDAILFTGKRHGKLKKAGVGLLKMTYEKFTFTCDKKTYEFETEKIAGMNIQSNDVFEFYYNETLYRFGFKTCHISPYKWAVAVDFIGEEASLE